MTLLERIERAGLLRAARELRRQGYNTVAVKLEQQAQRLA